MNHNRGPILDNHNRFYNNAPEVIEIRVKVLEEMHEKLRLAENRVLELESELWWKKNSTNAMDVTTKFIWTIMTVLFLIAMAVGTSYDYKMRMYKYNIMSKSADHFIDVIDKYVDKL
jgi:hypothetical protein